MTLEIAAITTTGGLLVTASALGTTLGGFFLLLTGLMAVGKRKRDTLVSKQHSKEEEMIKLTMFKVLNEIDQFDCTALALCNAVALPEMERSPVQMSLISMLSPQMGSPLSWADVTNPSAKYQYAAFMGIWASVTSNSTVCSQVFPRCPFPSAEILDFMASTEVLPCQSYLKNVNNVHN
ncbi:uncharacterized protein [Palaemon carinicauda]|uniref:uncharacterized protein n=1 Tax=Palaemon carinicauda TaxID=392227 RepID=UPI0035B6826A